MKVTEICGHQYQEGATAMAGIPMCKCETFAIGICGDCKAPVCGACSLIHGEVDEAAIRRCFNCALMFQQKRADAEKVKEAAEAARLAARLPMGKTELAAMFRGELNNPKRYVLRPVRGSLLAQVLADLDVPLYVAETRKGGYRSKRVRQQLLGWQIWQKKAPELSSDATAWEGMRNKDGPKMCLAEDGTVSVWELSRRVGKLSGSDKLLGYAQTTVIAASAYWCTTVLSSIAMFIHDHPGQQLKVRGRSYGHLYSDRIDVLE